MTYIGCPILGEPVYGDPHTKAQRAGRLMLHASGLELDHPETGQRMLFSADLPEEYLAQRQKLIKA
jgi:23S rRNA pseudouridine1911/1915/1917 synthase